MRLACHLFGILFQSSHQVHADVDFLFALVLPSPTKNAGPALNAFNTLVVAAAPPAAMSYFGLQVSGGVGCGLRRCGRWASGVAVGSGGVGCGGGRRPVKMGEERSRCGLGCSGWAALAGLGHCWGATLLGSRWARAGLPLGSRWAILGEALGSRWARAGISDRRNLTLKFELKVDAEGTTSSFGL